MLHQVFILCSRRGSRGGINTAIQGIWFAKINTVCHCVVVVKDGMYGLDVISEIVTDYSHGGRTCILAPGLSPQGVTEETMPYILCLAK
jgi:hypothetical protein